MAEAATTLGVSATTIRRMITHGLLPAHQPVEHAPWAIQHEDLALEQVQRAVAAIKRGARLPPTAAPAQLALDNSTT
jgi:hypothetical protein